MIATKAVLRPLGVGDIDGLLAVQRACYGARHVESRAVFTRRLASRAQCSLVALQAGAVCGYAAAYRSVLGQVTALHGDFACAAHPDTLYLHDLAVLPAHAGRGIAAALLARLLAQARDEALVHAALVAVQGAERYWQRHGFAARSLQDAAERERLASYGAGALYMARPVSVH